MRLIAIVEQAAVTPKRAAVMPEFEKPQKGRKRGGGKYPFWTMEIGEYFLVPEGKEDVCRVQAQRITRAGERGFEIQRNELTPWRVYRVK